jgi:hypothetical protein
MVVDAKGEFKFTPKMFSDWLERTGRANASSFEDDMMTKYKREVVAQFLKEHKFI